MASIEGPSRRSPLPFDNARVRRLIAENLTTTPDWRDSLARLALTLALLSGGAVLVLVGGPVGVVAGVVVLGVVAASGVSAIHETSHNALFRRRWLNELVGLLFGAVIVLPFAGYRVFHLRHHAATHVEDDTEPAAVVRSVPEWVGYLVASMFVLRWIVLVQLVAGLRGTNRRTRVLAVLSIVLGLVALGGLVAAAVVAPALVVTLYVAPMLVGGVISAVVAMPEHYGCEYGPADVVLTTRTTSTNAAGRFILWNGNYHTEHHLAPSVPTHQLGRFHDVLEPYLVFEERSYLRYHLDLLRSIRAGRPAAEPPWRAQGGEPVGG